MITRDGCKLQFILFLNFTYTIYTYIWLNHFVTLQHTCTNSPSYWVCEFVHVYYPVHLLRPHVTTGTYIGPFLQGHLREDTPLKRTKSKQPAL